MVVLNILFLTVLAYAFFRSVRGIYRIHHSLNWVADSRKTVEVTLPEKTEYRYVILMPVLREQDVVRENFHIFSNLEGRYEVVYITTQREDEEKKSLRKRLLYKLDRVVDSVSEYDFAEQLNGFLPRNVSLELHKKIKNIPDRGYKKECVIDTFDGTAHTRTIIQEMIAQTSSKNISIIDYPGISGVMAHQLNYACEQVLRTCDAKTTFLLVYNADSRVSRKLILIIDAMIRKNPEINVIQQSALFLDNYETLGSGTKKYFLQAIALLQSKWTLVHEIPRLLFQSGSKMGRLMEGAHVVGHGLCIRMDVLRKVHFFPTLSLNEDMQLGYILRLRGEIIYPLPLLESAQSPVAIKSMFNQYKTWFYGVAYYPAYIIHAIKNKDYSRFRALLWGLKYVCRAFMWLSSSFVWLFLFTYPLISGKPHLIVYSIGVFVMYAPLSFWIMQKMIRKKSNALYLLDMRPFNVHPLTYCMSLPVYVTHSVGPILATWQILKHLLWGTVIHKQKTER